MKAYLVCGLGFGDEGKGSVVDYLTYKLGLKKVVRYNGGHQAAHNVVNLKGIHHCFSQFGSGTFNTEVGTVLSEKMVINPISLINESDLLNRKLAKNALDRLTIDSDCLVTTPFHKMINRMQEVVRGGDRHGSCGVGVGQTIQDGKFFKDRALRFGDLLNKKLLLSKLIFIQMIKVDLAEQLLCQKEDSRYLREVLLKMKDSGYLRDITDYFYSFAKNSKAGTSHELIQGKDSDVVFEGAQGVLLGLNSGFLPYVTKSDTTFRNAENLLKKSGSFIDKKVRIGVLRAYFTRHGAGPFISEDSKLAQKIPDEHNLFSEWQGDFRIGWFDLVAARYALSCVGDIDFIAITNLDRLSGLRKIKVCSCYEYVGKVDDSMDDLFEWHLDCGRIIIDNIKKVEEAMRHLLYDLTEKLRLCKPVFTELDGWEKSIVKAYSMSGLPVQAQDYLRFLMSKDGMNVPISMVSVGPRSSDKFFI